jgi:hypothetical protein
MSALPLAEVMPVLLKEDLLWMAGLFGMTVPKSKKKEAVAQMVAEHLLTHPKEVLSLVPSNELKMLREMVKLESGSYLSRKTPSKHFWIQSLGLVITYEDKKGKRSNIMMLDELKSIYAPYLDDAIKDAKKNNDEEKSVKKTVVLKDPVKGILDGLDHLHGKYVHTWFMEQYINYGDYEFRDEFLVDGYCESYNDLMRTNDPLRVKDANKYIQAFMKEWYRDDPGLYYEALELLQEWASHQFMDMEASLKGRIDKDWFNAVTEEEGEELYNRIVGYPLEICNMMHEDGREEEAVANLFYLLEMTGDLYRFNQDLFESKSSSLVPKMKLMKWWLTELYLIVKGNPKVNDEIKSDMDFFLMDLQHRTQLFDEASTKWDDMFTDNQPYAEDDGLWKHYKEDMMKRKNDIVFVSRTC